MSLSKGKMLERKARGLLEEMGYRVEKTVHLRFQHKDFFGLWDLIAVNERNVSFIQVCCEKKGKDWLREAINFRVPDCARKEEWVWNKERKEFRIFLINEVGAHEVF